MTSPEPGKRRVARRTDDRVLGGVASGLGDYFGLDPLVLRIAFVGLSLAGGSGVVLYLLCWLLIPTRDEVDAAAVRAIRSSGTRRVMAYAVLTLAGLVLIGPLLQEFGQRFGGGIYAGGLGPLELLFALIGLFFPLLIGAALIYGLVRLLSEDRRPRSIGEEAGRSFTMRNVLAGALIAVILLVFLGSALTTFGAGGVVDSAVVWALLLVALGFALLRERQTSYAGATQVRHGDASGTREWPATPSAAAPEEHAVVTSTLDDPLTSTEGQPSPARPARVRSPLGWLGLAAAMLVVGLVALLNNAGVTALGGAQLLALGLLLLGLALVIGAYWGRARWLILVGILLLPAVAVASLLDLPLRGALGDGYVVYRRPTQLRNGYQLLAGSTTLDLTQLDFNAGRTLELPVDMVVGGLTVIVPYGIAVDARGELGVGELDFFGTMRSGVELSLDASDGASDARRRLVLEMDADVGSIVVYRKGLVKDRRVESRREPRRDTSKPSRRERRRERQGDQTGDPEKRGK